MKKKSVSFRRSRRRAAFHLHPDYWKVRAEKRYYRKAVRYGRLFAPNAQSVLDVGSNACEYINWMDWIPERVRIDPLPVGELDGVTTIQGDFMEYQPPNPFDLILCLQVLEHVKDPGAFCARLLGMGKVIVISVPYRWPPMRNSDHLHDPVDDEKLISWTGRPALARRVVSDDKGSKGRRLVAVFKGDACSRMDSLLLRWRVFRRSRRPHSP